MIDRVRNGFPWQRPSPQTVLGSEKNPDIDPRVEKELGRRRPGSGKACVVRNEADSESPQDTRRVTGEDLDPRDHPGRSGLLRRAGLDQDEQAHHPGRRWHCPIKCLFHGRACHYVLTRFPMAL